MNHTDVRPLILALVGLEDPYAHDARLLIEGLKRWTIPPAARRPIFSELAAAYKQINVPFGDLSVNALKVSTAGLKSTDPNDTTYHRLSNQISAWTGQRDGLAALMQYFLDAAVFDNVPIDHPTAKLLIDEARDLQKEVERAAKLLVIVRGRRGATTLRRSRDRSLSAVFHNYGDVFSGQAARLISLALSLVNRLARSTRVNAH